MRALPTFRKRASFRAYSFCVCVRECVCVCVYVCVCVCVFAAMYRQCLSSEPALLAVCCNWLFCSALQYFTASSRMLQEHHDAMQILDPYSQMAHLSCPVCLKTIYIYMHIHIYVCTELCLISMNHVSYECMHVYRSWLACAHVWA